MAPSKSNSMRPSESHQNFASRKSKEISKSTFSQSTSATPSTGNTLQHGSRRQPEDLAHLTLTYTQDNRPILYYSNTLHDLNSSNDNSHYDNTKHKDLVVDQRNTLSPALTYYQTSHKSHHQPLPTATQTPIQRWLDEDSRQSPWDAVASFRPLSDSTRRVQGEDISYDSDERISGNGNEFKYDEGHVEDAWSSAGTWGSADGFEGVRMVRG